MHGAVPPKSFHHSHSYHLWDAVPLQIILLSVEDVARYLPLLAITLSPLLVLSITVAIWVVLSKCIRSIVCCRWVGNLEHEPLRLLSCLATLTYSNSAILFLLSRFDAAQAQNQKPDASQEFGIKGENTQAHWRKVANFSKMLGGSR